VSPKSIKNKGFYDPKALSQVLERQRYRANIMSPEKMPVSKKGNKKGVVATGFGRIRKEVMRTHVFRKMFATTCNKLGMNTTIKEKLMGHKTGQGLDVYYDRTTEETFIQEYLKIIDELTINEENKLKHEVVELKKENEEINLLKQKLMELEKDKKDYEEKTKKELEALWERDEQHEIEVYDEAVRFATTRQKKPTKKVKTVFSYERERERENRKLERRRINLLKKKQG